MGSIHPIASGRQMFLRDSFIGISLLRARFSTFGRDLHGADLAGLLKLRLIRVGMKKSKMKSTSPKMMNTTKLATTFPRSTAGTPARASQCPMRASPPRQRPHRALLHFRPARQSRRRLRLYPAPGLPAVARLVGGRYPSDGSRGYSTLRCPRTARRVLISPRSWNSPASFAFGRWTGKAPPMSSPSRRPTRDPPARDAPPVPAGDGVDLLEL